ncbi:MAG: hypothetical protein EGR33_09085 [Prevotella sp.]|nr:hypothetical protein [Prevotella sp.]
MALLDFQFVFGRHNIRPPHFASKVSYSASPQTFAECSRDAPCSAATAMLFGNTAQRFFYIFNALPFKGKKKQAAPRCRWLPACWLHIGLVGYLL